MLVAILLNDGLAKTHRRAHVINLFVSPLTGILSSMNMIALIPVLAPYPLASPLFNFAAAIVETAGMAALVYGRLVRAGRFAPAAA